MALSLDSSSGYSNSASELLRFGKREGKKACSSGDSYLRTILWSASCMMLFSIVYVCGGEGVMHNNGENNLDQNIKKRE